ncbi:MAG: heavy-metal-associated domain-containing protein [Vitreoscilla sp.]|nr:heavy-metal-associated domain-containing protein [Burkholderiales bacterium]MBP6336579.1 heavy-metal-associated domain-containing protein [Vitreoscilla sp.]MBP6675844.1 heavy-metal-associated domain-containing protein [Vitreoscilla sp.]
MIAFQVNDMTCNHCVGSITQALMKVDPAANVQVNLAQHQVLVEPGIASAAQLTGAIADAGFTPVSIEVPAGQAAPAKSGCCGACGGGH